KDYSMSFKLQLVSSIENGELTATQAVERYGIQARSTVTGWMRKYGTFDWQNKKPHIQCQNLPNNVFWSLSKRTDF
ncbi:helix-turn-helix domain-containing protein, partial [Maribacter aquimaris]|uniref:helix-turn-helix domain-containing protein n=1 Tax=Maribacter aquimaris TaxID=2737171 RepID=UPI001CB730B5